MRVLFLTLYPEVIPSSRLRVYQYLPFLKVYGIQADVLPAVSEPWFSHLFFSKHRWMKAIYCLVEVCRGYGRVMRAGQYDAVFIQKGITSSAIRGLEKILQCRAKRIFFDFDDDVIEDTILSFQNPVLRWLQDSRQNQKLVKVAHVVIAGSDHLRQRVLRLNPRTVLLPTPVDTDRFSPGVCKKKSAGNEVVIGWIGQVVGLSYLEGLTAVFVRLSQRYDICVKVISRQPQGKPFVMPGVKTQFVEWRYETEVEEAREFNIGVMPVPQDALGAGKCGLKLLQYMALGIPGVATDVGANREIVSEGVDAFLARSSNDWEGKLAMLIESSDLRARVGMAARKKVEVQYSLKTLAPRFAAILKGECELPEFRAESSSESFKTSCNDAVPARSLKKLLRILFVLPELKIGGAEMHVARLAEGLRKRGHDARILCVLKEGKLAPLVREKKIPLDLLNRPKWDLSVVHAIKKYLDSNACQIVHTYLFGFHFFAGFPARLTGLSKVISSRRDVELLQPVRVLWLEKLGNLFCDHVIACSEAVGKWVLGRENLRPEKITILYNGLALAEFVPGRGREEIRQEFLLPEGAFVVGTVANFSFKKGYSYLIEAAARVLEIQPKCYFLLVGAGSLEREMKEKVAQFPLSLGKRILFAGARNDVPRLLAAMDVFVFASLWEGLPNGVLEAMAMGLPVISTPAGGVPEVLADGVNGRLVPFRDPHTMAEAILELMSHPDKAAELGRAARKKIETEFTLERMIDQYEKFYQNLMDSPAQTDLTGTSFGGKSSVGLPDGQEGKLKGVRFPPETCGNDTPPSAQSSVNRQGRF